MAVAQITLTALESGDSVVISPPDPQQPDSYIALDTDPKGMYATAFTARTQSGAFEPGGRIVGTKIPMREILLPLWLDSRSRSRLQKMFGTPGNFKKVQYTVNTTVSGPRWVILKLSKEIDYATEDGLDADIDDMYHAGIVSLALNTNFESPETVSSWTNPDDRFTVAYSHVAGGTMQLAFTEKISGTSATTGDIAWNATPAQVQAALVALPNVGAGHVNVSGSAGNWLAVFVGVNGVLTIAQDKLTGSEILNSYKTFTIEYAPNTGWFSVWNPTDQALWLEWTFDPAKSWQFPDFSFGGERKFNRPVGADAARMIVTPELTQMLSVMSDPLQDTYINADLSNAAGLFAGVHPVYMVPPYTHPVMMPVVCQGPAGAKVTLRQRRFWSAESGLEE